MCLDGKDEAASGKFPPVPGPLPPWKTLRTVFALQKCSNADDQIATTGEIKHKQQCGFFKSLLETQFQIFFNSRQN